MNKRKKEKATTSHLALGLGSGDDRHAELREVLRPPHSS
jgi:hypothetical protein